MSLALTTA
jgi:hypothetical protein